MSYLVNKKIFITGGTGSLGKALIKKLLKLKARPIIYSRDEGKQALCFNNGENVKFCRIEYSAPSTSNFSTI